MGPIITGGQTAAPWRRSVARGERAYGAVAWKRRDVRVGHWRDDATVFEQLGCEFPADWSSGACETVAQRYFRAHGVDGGRERSLRQVVDRVVDTIVGWGSEDGYFDDDEAAAFTEELKYLLITQRAAFNSPVWFNIGVPGAAQQASSCFILPVEDSLDGIFDWYRAEGRVFAGGAGTGTNLSGLRSSHEALDDGGPAAGPVQIMRGADASAGALKVTGLRRAAKMCILDAGHPDVSAFIRCKADEERKARVLRDAGFDMAVDGADAASLHFQHANNTVRVTDEFMRAVVADEEWQLRAVADGRVLRRLPARRLWREIAEAARECGDPGVHFDTTINGWHTVPTAGRINGSNSCSEFMHLDGSATVLASVNLLRFLDPVTNTFDVEGFLHAGRVVFTALDILIGHGAYPTPAIGDVTRRFRPVGLGYANLGALLMSLGLAYDSTAGRAWAATLTAALTGNAYRTSAELAHRVGPCEGFADDDHYVIDVLRRHQAAVARIDGIDSVPPELAAAASCAWSDAVLGAEAHGVRNSQASAIAPTGTIGFMMGCDTTGIEPDLALRKTQRFTDGTAVTSANRAVPRALRALGYDDDQIRDVVVHIATHGSGLAAPHLRAEHLEVFACAIGDHVIAPAGHVRMIAAVQPFVSGAISKTVNMPATATVEDVEEVLLSAWRLGLKAVTVYCDQAKVHQPLTAERGQAGQKPES